MSESSKPLSNPEELSEPAVLKKEQKPKQEPDSPDQIPLAQPLQNVNIESNLNKLSFNLSVLQFKKQSILNSLLLIKPHYHSYLSYVSQNINQVNATSLDKFQEVFDLILLTEKQQMPP